MEENKKTNINSVNALKTLLPNEKIKSHLVTRSFLRERARFPGFNGPRVQLVKWPIKKASQKGSGKWVHFFFGAVVVGGM